MTQRAMSIALALIAACATQSSRTLPQPAAKPEASRLPAELARLNAQAARGSVVEVIGGQRVVDPYRALERDDAQTQAWIAAQTERTERDLAKLRSPEAEARLTKLLSIGSLGEVSMGGTRVFFMLREAPRERPALYMLDVGQPGVKPPLPTQPLIDPQQFGERAAIDYMAPSQDGKYVAFGVSENGDERALLHVYDVERARLLDDRIEHAKWSAIEWRHDDSGFYYRRYPKPGEPHWDEHEPDSYFSQLFLHRLGADPARDPLVFAGDKPTEFPEPALDESDRYLTITNERSWTASDVWLWDRGAAPAARGDAPASGALVPIVRGLDNLTSGKVSDGELYLITNIGAPKKRVVRVDIAHAAERERWRDVVPESDATIEDAAITRNFIVVHRIAGLQSTLELFTKDGEPRGKVALPGRGSISALASDYQSDRIAFVWSSFLVAPSLFECALQSGDVEQLYQVQHDFDASRYELQEANVRSADGTPIHVDYLQRRGTPRDRQNPVLVYGYGGFDIALLPNFARSALYFLERGGIYAQVNLRGGGEFGEAWHRAGMLKNKIHVFEDCEAVLRWFSDSGISNPSRIALSGGSNGGLLVGALITRAPDAFAAATAYVGLYDMMRYEKFPPAALWISEYGDPNDPAMSGYLLSYSPYHQIREGRAYPASLIETADHDTRVFWGHSTKFAARLQSANSGDKPIYFYMERAIGHGRGTGISDLVKRYARQYAFLEHALGMNAPAAPR